MNTKSNQSFRLHTNIRIKSAALTVIFNTWRILEVSCMTFHNRHWSNVILRCCLWFVFPILVHLHDNSAFIFTLHLCQKNDLKHPEPVPSMCEVGKAKNMVSFRESIIILITVIIVWISCVARQIHAFPKVKSTDIVLSWPSLSSQASIQPWLL